MSHPRINESQEEDQDDSDSSEIVLKNKSKTKRFDKPTEEALDKVKQPGYKAFGQAGMQDDEMFDEPELGEPIDSNKNKSKSKVKEELVTPMRKVDQGEEDDEEHVLLNKKSKPKDLRKMGKSKKKGNDKDEQDDYVKMRSYKKLGTGLDGSAERAQDRDNVKLMPYKKFGTQE